jgi:acetylglutamate synthase
MVTAHEQAVAENIFAQLTQQINTNVANVLAEMLITSYQLPYTKKEKVDITDDLKQFEERTKKKEEFTSEETESGYQFVDKRRGR